MAQRAVEQIFDINIARLQIGIAQLAILLAEIDQHLIPPHSAPALLLAQDGAGGVIEFRVVEQGVMTGENGRDIGGVALLCQAGQGVEIRQRLLNGLLQAPLLFGAIGAVSPPRLGMRQG
ncbi:Uncharacterised protein [Raoultella terrigena]|uniref:Uncharacterized protein n=1 Tax=Raoultella terrigena TaxID=577 RepID=A0A4V6J1X9_RAOTE|nr:Uncharacterised protein [Raoultella terrigena]